MAHRAKTPPKQETTGAVTRRAAAMALALAVFAAVWTGLATPWSPAPVPCLPGTPTATEQSTEQSSEEGTGESAEVPAHAERADAGAPAPGDEAGLPASGFVAARFVDPSGTPLDGVYAMVHGDPNHIPGFDETWAWAPGHARRGPDVGRALQTNHAGFFGRIHVTAGVLPISGPDGRVRLEAAGTTLEKRTLEVRAPGRVSLSLPVPTVEPGAELDLGDVVLEPGSRLRGDLLGAEGFPAVDGERTVIRLRHGEPPDETPDEPSDEPSEGGRGPGTDREAANGRRHDALAVVGPDGAFEFTRRLPYGRVRLTCARLGVDTTVHLHAPETHVRLRVEESATADRIVGSCVDSVTGDPIAGALLVLRNDVRAQSNAAGAFAIPVPSRRRAWTATVTREGYEATTTPHPVRAGAPPVTIRMRRYSRLEVEVRDAAGRPVDRCRVDLVASAGSSRMPPTPRRPDPAVDGLHRRLGPHEGRGVLLVRPLPGTRLAAASREVRFVDGAPQRFAVRLAGSRTQEVVVRTPDGAPVGGSRVLLLDALAAAVAPGRNDVALDEATTDAAGRAVLRGPPATPLAVLCTGKHATLLVPEHVLTDELLELVLAPAGTLLVHDHPSLYPQARGERDMATALGYPNVTATRLDGADPHEQVRTASFEGGTARFEQLPPGLWQVRVEWLEPGLRPSSKLLPPAVQVAPGATVERTAAVR